MVLPANESLTYHLTFWSDATATALCVLLIIWLRRQRLRAQKGYGVARAVILPIYEPVLWALGVMFLAQTLLLGVPGPYPKTPIWFQGADYETNDDTGDPATATPAADYADSAMYFSYWFTFELMAEGFGILLLHRYPSPQAFASTLQFGVMYALLAGGLTTLGYNYAPLGWQERLQLILDSVFLALPCGLYGLMVLPLSLLSSRASMIPWAIFSLAWRLVSVIAINLDIYSTTLLGAILSSVRSVLTPIAIYATLVLDSYYWRNLGLRALENADALLLKEEQAALSEANGSSEIGAHGGYQSPQGLIDPRRLAIARRRAKAEARIRAAAAARSGAIGVGSDSHSSDRDSDGDSRRSRSRSMSIGSTSSIGSSNSRARSSSRSRRASTSSRSSRGSSAASPTHVLGEASTSSAAKERRRRSRSRSGGSGSAAAAAVDAASQSVSNEKHALIGLDRRLERSHSLDAASPGAAPFFARLLGSGGRRKQASAHVGSEDGSTRLLSPHGGASGGYGATSTAGESTPSATSDERLARGLLSTPISATAAVGNIASKTGVDAQAYSGALRSHSSLQLKSRTSLLNSLTSALSFGWLRSGSSSRNSSSRYTGEEDDDASSLRGSTISSPFASAPNTGGNRGTVRSGSSASSSRLSVGSGSATGGAVDNDGGTGGAPDAGDAAGRRQSGKKSGGKKNAASDSAAADIVFLADALPSKPSSPGDGSNSNNDSARSVRSRAYTVRSDWDGGAGGGSGQDDLDEVSISLDAQLIQVGDQEMQPISSYFQSASAASTGAPFAASPAQPRRSSEGGATDVTPLTRSRLRSNGSATSGDRDGGSGHKHNSRSRGKGRSSSSSSSKHQPGIEHVRRFQRNNQRFLVDFSELQIGNFLARGATSDVYSGVYKGAPVAIKMFRPEKIDEFAVAHFHK